MRGYIRHPDAIPLEVSLASNTIVAENDERPGLCCSVKQAFAPGTVVRIHIPLPPEPFTAYGKVRCCSWQQGRWLAKITLPSAQACYRLRMAEQLCQIEVYRQDVVVQQGRALGLEQAAAEWIARYAAEFDHHFALS